MHGVSVVLTYHVHRLPQQELIHIHCLVRALLLQVL